MSSKIHQKHPKCPECGKALYKSPIKGKPVKKTDPYAFCRNPKCKVFENPLETTIPEEPEAVKKARMRIRKLIATRPDAMDVIKDRGLKEGADVASMGITLAIASQETGDMETANKLIDEYNLTEKYGIQKQSSVVREEEQKSEDQPAALRKDQD